MPPMVGVPALARCVCGPSERTFCPSFTRRSQPIITGPNSRLIASAVMAA